MTAIVRTYTPEGFVVAADGRVAGSRDAKISKETAQKIFPVIDGEICMAYSFCGVIGIPAEDGSGNDLDLGQQAHDAALGLVGAKTSDLRDYASRVGQHICGSLEEFLRAGHISKYDEAQTAPGEHGTTIARFLFDGYHHGRPSAISLRIFHEGGEKCFYEPTSDPIYPPGLHRIMGSPVIVQLLFESDDERFRKYRTKFLWAHQILLNDAIERSTAYINACSDAALAKIDPMCRYIGGQIHIAAITSKGFRWIIAPK